MATLACHRIEYRDLPCVHRRCTTRLADLGLDLPDVYTFQDCVKNEVLSLHNRHLVDKLPYPDWFEVGEGRFRLAGGDREVLPGWTQGRIMDLRWRVAEDWMDGRVVDRMSMLDIMGKFGGAKRDAMFRAHHVNSWALPSGKVEAFIKVDYHSAEEVESKPPRMIQYRGPAFNIELAPWLEPAERELLHGPGLGPTRLPSCSKGMLMEERAQVMADKRYCFQDPVAVCMDYSAFDSTQFSHVLRQEHQVWEKMCPGLNRRLLARQMRNRCTTKNGIRYQACGTRMSGDRNTGGGNSVTNVLNFYTICRMLGIEAEFICDGDDSVAWMERADSARFMEVAEVVVGKAFGMILRDITVVDSADDEYYCQHKNIMCKDGIARPTRDPRRILTRLPWTPTGVRGAEALDLMVAKLLSEMVVNRHVPAMARCFQRALMACSSPRRVAGSIVERQLIHRTVSSGVDLMKYLGSSLDWVGAEVFDDDPIAEAELRRLYGITDGEWELFCNWDKWMVLHPSCLAGKGKARINCERHRMEYCDLCDTATVSR